MIKKRTWIEMIIGLFLITRIFVWASEDVWEKEVGLELLTASKDVRVLASYPGAIVLPVLLNSADNVVITGRVLSIVAWLVMAWLLMMTRPQKPLCLLLCLAFLPGLFEFSALCWPTMLSCMFMALSINALFYHDLIPRLRAAIGLAGMVVCHYATLPLAIVLLFAAIAARRITVLRLFEIVGLVALIWLPFTGIMVYQIKTSSLAAMEGTAPFDALEFVSGIFRPLTLHPFLLCAHLAGYLWLLVQSVSNRSYWSWVVLAGFAALSLSFLVFPAIGSRHHLIFLLPLLALALSEGVRSRRSSLLLVFLLSASLYQMHLEAVYRNGTRQIAALINKSVAPGDVVVLTDSKDALSIKSFLNKGILWYTSDTGAGATSDTRLLLRSRLAPNPKTLKKRTEHAERIWLLHPRHQQKNKGWSGRKISDSYVLEGGPAGDRRLDLLIH